MFNLLLKDLFIQKKIVLFGILYCIFALFAFKDIYPSGGALYVLAPIAFNYILLTTASNYDDKNKNEMLINSLPVNRDDIVISKYLSIFFFSFITIICASIIGIICRLIGLSIIGRIVSLDDILIVISVTAIMYSVYFPLYFKFGTMKLRLFTILLFMLVLFVPNFITEYTMKHPNDNLVKNILSFISNTQPIYLKLLILIVTIILLLTSIFLSLSIYKKKQFS